MAKYRVFVPIAGQLVVMVDAESNVEAIEKFWDMYHAGDLQVNEGLDWDPYSRLTSGNVLHAPLNEVEAMKIE